MTSENDRCAKNPNDTLHNSLHNYCTIPVLSSLIEQKQAIFKLLYKYFPNTAAEIARKLTRDERGWSKRTLFYHINDLKKRGFIEELTETKPYPLQLTTLGRKVVQLASAPVTPTWDKWVRLEKAFIRYDLSEVSPGDLSNFKGAILSGKWGKVSSVTDLNWLKVIVKSRFPFFTGGTFEFHFDTKNVPPRFFAYLTENYGENEETAYFNAFTQATYLYSRLSRYFLDHGIELIDPLLNHEGVTEGPKAEYESPFPGEMTKRVRKKTENGEEYWVDESKGYSEWGQKKQFTMRGEKLIQATRMFNLPQQIDSLKDELKDDLIQLKAGHYQLIKEKTTREDQVLALKENMGRLEEKMDEKMTAIEKKIDEIIASLKKNNR